MRYRIFGRAACAAMLALAAAVAPAQDAGTVLRVVPPAELKILDPIWTTSSATRNHGYMVYDTLFGTDADGHAQPQMVDKYSASADRKTWEFTLRPGLAFSDGTPVTSQDVIASLTRWGQRDAIGQRMFAAMDKLQAIDANSFRMSFREPFGLVAEVLGKTSANVPFIMPRRVAQTPADKQIDDPIGSGPFVLDKGGFRAGDRVVYLRNAKYKPRPEPASGTAGGKRVHVDRVEWIALKDAQTQVSALLNGEIDVIEYAPAEHYPTLRTDARTELVDVLPPQMMTVHFNHLVPPFDNPKVVRAALLAINQEAMLRAQAPYRDLYRPCASIAPCGAATAAGDAPWFTGKPQFEQARSLLKEAGYDGKPVVLMQPTDQVLLNKYPLVYAQLLKQAGFNVEVQSMDWGTLISRRARKEPADKGGWNVFITGWSGSDAINPLFYPPLTGNGEQGYFGWPSDAQLENLKTRFLAAGDPAERQRVAALIGQRALEAGVIGPIGEMNVLTAIRRGALSGLLKGQLGVYWNVRKNPIGTRSQ
ncbi:ABC transporter substrate-binding protein [Variovorax sp. PBL-E5]|uniref:ABC transporter substrate-binding protein n=1 Tax=Variovorax sp. PBL-E5 TaxID=434014 RepID=UPI0013199D2C|nr:ABC transporter substrate-binding protein [Variovorax sp. PBL-E5]VTU25173.1 Glutathione-binding protein GsiB precursor [Variovorax sp. PBL-E5]